MLKLWDLFALVGIASVGAGLALAVLTGLVFLSDRLVEKDLKKQKEKKLE